MSNALKVLLIEDNDDHAKIIQRLASRATSIVIRIVHENSLRRGMERLSNETFFDALLLDLRLPDSSGPETLPKVLSVAGRVPIIVLTSLDDQDLAEHAIRQGAQDFLSKSALTGELLTSAIRNAISRKESEERLRRHGLQQKILFELSQNAITEGDLGTILRQAAELTAKALSVDYVKILELLPDGKTLLLKAGVGWQEGVVGVATIDANAGSQAGYTLLTSPTQGLGGKANVGPVVVEDYHLERRFKPPALLSVHNVVGGMSVIILSRDDSRPYGVMGVNTRTARKFSEEDAAFLQSTANIIAAAIHRHRLEERLRQQIDDLTSSEAKFRGLLESAPDAMVVVDRQRRIVFVNSLAEKMFGYEGSELRGKAIEMLVPARIRKDHERYAQQYIENPGTRPMGAGRELYGVRKDRREFPVEIRLSPIESPEGRLVSSAIRDITDRKKLEMELMRAKDEAEAANQAKSYFLANMSHEIRTPLTAIMGFADLLLDNHVSDDERSEYLSTICRNGHLLTQIIDDILDLSKVESGKFKVEIVKCSLPNLVSDVMVLLEQQARGKGVHLEVSSDGEVPERIATDPIRLKQILINIIGNAIKFTAQGEVDVIVRAVKHPSGSKLGKIEFEVHDTGKGITPDCVGVLFQPFSQADISTTRKYGGTGLGLVLSRKLAQALGGDVILRDTVPGKGSTFVVSIHSDWTEGWTAIGNARLESGSSFHKDEKSLPLAGLNILVVEDSPDNQVLIAQILRYEGAGVDIADNGAEAINKAIATEFDIILMDLQMPVKSGLEATSELRRYGYKKPIIALTAAALKDVRERSHAAGCDDYLTKPINKGSLVWKVQQYARSMLDDGRF